MSGYSYAYEPGSTPDRWNYEIYNPAGIPVCSGARLGTESDLIDSLKRMAKRLSADFGHSGRRVQLTVNPHKHTPRGHV